MAGNPDRDVTVVPTSFPPDLLTVRTPPVGSIRHVLSRESWATASSSSCSSELIYLLYLRKRLKSLPPSSKRKGDCFDWIVFNILTRKTNRKARRKQAIFHKMKMNLDLFLNSTNNQHLESASFVPLIIFYKAPNYVHFR
jgi:hypothetical protein